MESIRSDLGEAQPANAVAEARRSLEELNERVVTFVKAHPTACLLGAVALGFIVGRVAARS